MADELVKRKDSYLGNEITETTVLKISVIVPFSNVSEYTLECIKHCGMLNYGCYEVILLPDNDINGAIFPENFRVIPTGHVPPGTKRNIGAGKASGSVLAFIDDDAYPHPDWLNNALKYFEDEQVACVGGPNLTPASDTIHQKASGRTLSSRVGGGSASYRYRVSKTKLDDDIPSCNLIVRKNVYDEIGGFDMRFWPGEDTYLCNRVGELGFKIVYASDVVVYHHRRSFWKGHLHQIWRYGLHRGYFAKRFPSNSRKFGYFLPSTFVIGLVLSIPLGVFVPSLTPIVAGAILAYCGLCVVEGLKTREIRLSLLVSLGIIVTHITYGLAFIAGLLRRDLKDV